MKLNEREDEDEMSEQNSKIVRLRVGRRRCRCKFLVFFFFHQFFKQSQIVLQTDVGN